MRTLFILSAAALAMALAGPAGALPPHHATFSFAPAPQVIGQCDGDDVVARFQITVRETLFLDETGEPTGARVLMRVPSVVTNTGTGVSVTGTGVRVIRERFTDGWFQVSGSGVHVVVPGIGTLNLEAGLERERDGEYTVTGHRVTGLTPEFCAALAA